MNLTVTARPIVPNTELDDWWSEGEDGHKSFNGQESYRTFRYRIAAGSREEAIEIALGMTFSVPDEAKSQQPKIRGNNFL